MPAVLLPKINNEIIGANKPTSSSVLMLMAPSHIPTRLPPHRHDAGKHRLVHHGPSQAAPVLVDIHRGDDLLLVLMLMLLVMMLMLLINPLSLPHMLLMLLLLLHRMRQHMRNRQIIKTPRLCRPAHHDLLLGVRGHHAMDHWPSLVRLLLLWLLRLLKVKHRQRFYGRVLGSGRCRREIPLLSHEGAVIACVMLLNEGVILPGIGLPHKRIVFPIRYRRRR